ncbi:MAG TPA: GNAT family N-acetyltransferase [Pseudonocardiaceae bacterium]|nr:GNAT family N-acetyltransferase [Pseudonocardiaceae bacterium]
MSPSDGIDFRVVSAGEAAGHVDELTAACREVYCEPPYSWDAEREQLFLASFDWQRQNAGFRLVEARCGDELIGFGLGVTLPPATRWWERLLTPLPAEVTREYDNRTFALVEFLVRRPWRRRHVAETLHHRILLDRHEERATLTVRPAAHPAQAAYAKWGWRKVAQKHNPLPGSPVFDVLLKQLGPTA